jgi:hypothetical protein
MSNPSDIGSSADILPKQASMLNRQQAKRASGVKAIGMSSPIWPHLKV